MPDTHFPVVVARALADACQPSDAKATGTSGIIAAGGGDVVPRAARLGELVHAAGPGPGPTDRLPVALCFRYHPPCNRAASAAVVWS
jgi:hypothetical protein